MDATFGQVEAVAAGRATVDAQDPRKLCDIGTIAAALGRANALERASRAGLDLDCISSYNIGPLHAAASGGRIELVDWLLARGANPDLLSEESRRRTPIMFAAYYGRLPVIGRLLQVDTEPCRSVPRSSLLVYAVMSGRDQVVMRVLPACATSKGAAYHLSMGLFMAASQGRKEILIDIMNAAPKDADMAKLGVAALIIAAGKGRSEVIEALLDRGVPANVRDRGGMTPLMVAAAADQGDAVSTLLRRGADPNAYDDGGTSALGWAAVTGAVKALQLLLSSGVEVDAHQEPCGNTALHYAAWHHKLAAVRALLSRGADTTIPNCDGSDVMSLARRRGLSDVVGLLQGAQADGRH